MVYLTYKKQESYKQQNLFELILSDAEFTKNSLEYPQYLTIKTQTVAKTLFNEKQLVNLKSISKILDQRFIKDLLEEGTDKHYTSFKIPKATGSFRNIDAPDEALKNVLRSIKDYLQDTCKIHAHNNAFAYIPKRCARHALEKHQYNKSKHFLHLDLKDFFSNCTEDFIHNQLKQVYPFSEMYKNTEDTRIMLALVKLSLYKGHLPQGTPLSPYLTNIIMIPIDYAIYNMCKQWNKQHFVYTRYADDIDISSQYDFNYREFLNELKSIIEKETPLRINLNKVHYGTTAGRNWHLGMMLNNENKITLGHKRKREIKTSLLLFCKYKDQWTKADLQSFQGELAYFRSIEPEYSEHLITEYSKKYNNNINILEETKELLK